MSSTVYVIRNSLGQLYVGHTENLGQRLASHNSGLSRWTSKRGPWELVHREELQSRAAAMVRERTLKSGRANQELRKKLFQSVERVLPGKD